MITETEGESWLNEGCLSVPNVRLDVKTSKITMDFQDRTGKKFSKQFDGLLATVIQHEVDHLNGNLIIDRVHEVEKIGIKKNSIQSKKLQEQKLIPNKKLVFDKIEKISFLVESLNENCFYG